MPLLVISQFAKQDYVDHPITDHSSVLRFIEDNWQLGRIGSQSFDENARSLLGTFDFEREHGPDAEKRVLLLDPSTGLSAHGDGNGD